MFQLLNCMTLLTNCHLWSPGSEKNSLLLFTAHIFHFLHKVLTALTAPRRKSPSQSPCRVEKAYVHPDERLTVSWYLSHQMQLVSFDLFHFYLFHGLNTQKLKKK